MTVQFAQVKGRLVQDEDILLIDSKPFTGVIHRKTQFGKNETHYFKGQKHGIFKEYYLNDVLKTVALYKLGKLNGRYIEYFPNGSKKLHVSYVSDKKDGLCEEFFEDGRSKTIRTFYRDKLITIKAL